jgi:superfamily I DNA/RNA helicase
MHIRPERWFPIGVDSLEPNADVVVRSNINYSVIAGPGAGKTELLAQRACYLLQTGKCRYPYRILAISFKKDAAKNLKDRVNQRCHAKDAVRFDSLTFAAFAKNLVDRFIRSIPEYWQPPESYEIYDSNQVKKAIPGFLLELAKKEDNQCIQECLRDIYNRNDASSSKNFFEKRYILGFCLPTEIEKISSVYSNKIKDPGCYAALEWWNTCLRVGDRSLISFPMIERIAELILRTNPLVLSALRKTYTHAFLDEFQDTTHVQYDLVKMAFLNSQTILTAVGDNKQQIMRWAMALDDAFGDFENDFGAKRIQLISNYRSSAKLVGIQHYLACTIDPNSKRVVAQKPVSIKDDACVIWEFNSPKSEAEHLAKFISSSVNNSELTPRDFALLVKQKADNYANLLMPVFQQPSYNLKARVEAELQDILAERLTLILITFLRFGSKNRAGIYWSDCCNMVEHLRGVDLEDSKIRRSIQNELNEFHSVLKGRMKRLTKHKIQTKFLLETIVAFIGQENIERTYPEYKQSERCKEIIEKVADYLTQSCEAIDNNDWNVALDSFEGKDSIPIMTIHKSKGLEYHTVIFVGLDDEAWWSFAEQPEDSRSAFFVAFSRAKQRIIFTYCKQRGERTKIASFYDVLRSAGVEIKYIA